MGAFSFSAVTLWKQLWQLPTRVQFRHTGLFYDLPSSMCGLMRLWASMATLNYYFRAASVSYCRPAPLPARPSAAAPPPPILRSDLSNLMGNFGCNRSVAMGLPTSVDEVQRLVLASPQARIGYSAEIFRWQAAASR